MSHADREDRTAQPDIGQDRTRAAMTGAVRGGHGGHRDCAATERAGETQGTSYYGRPILKEAPWSARDIGGYLFLGGLAGASSALAAGAEFTGRPRLARGAKLGALGAVGGSLVALINDLGRPARFLNMLRVIKPTSPMSVGSWLLVAYGPAAGAAAVSDVTGLFRPMGRMATGTAGIIGPALAAYTAVLICDTAVPAWHEGYREMPFVFTASAAAAAGGLGLIVAPPRESSPALRIAVAGASVEFLARHRMDQRLNAVTDAHRTGRAGTLRTVATGLTLAGVLGACLFSRHDRAVACLSGAALLAGSLCTRLSLFHGGQQSARRPQDVIASQRDGSTSTD